MAQSTDPNQTIDQSHASEAPALAIEDIDSMIMAEDPNFAKELLEVSALPADGSIDLDVVDLGESLAPLGAENPWRHPIGLRKFLVTIMPFLPAAWDFRHRVQLRVRHFRNHATEDLKSLAPHILHGVKAFASGTASVIKGRISAFAALNWRLKLVAIALIGLSVGTAAFIYRSYTHGVLPEDKELFMASLDEWAGETYKFDAESEMDSFYDSPRTIQNIMSLPKMIVNIKPSASSGTNPMAAMEFFLEGLSPEANVEVKDRESEIRDLFQRTMEDMSFDQLDSAEGKQLLTEHLRENLNAILSTGKIRRVYIKEAVIKP